jgi:hypothetical protein
MLLIIILGIFIQPYPLPIMAVQAKGFCTYVSESFCVASVSFLEKIQGKKLLFHC